MIPFAEKLSFLMRITETSNKDLAAELSVDPSMISHLRTGKRKLSKAPMQAHKLAAYFALHSPAAFQRQALSDMIGLVSISPSMPVGELAERIENWLLGNEASMADTLLSGIQALPEQMGKLQVVSEETAPLPPPDGKTMFFYGESGRRESLGRLFQEIRNMAVPSSVHVVVDDNLEWLLSDYPLSRRVQSTLISLMDQGFSFHQIMPPLNFINRYTESLQFWLPIYATGKMSVYYYPRLRGNLYRHSIIVVPGCCAQYSSTVGYGSICDITMFTTDPTLVKAFESQFQEHLSMCRPSLNVYQDTGRMFLRLNDLFSSEGDTIQSNNVLSASTMPRELLERCIHEAGLPSWKHGFQVCLDHISNYEAHLAKWQHIDMSILATAEEVRSGKVSIASPHVDYPQHPRYTPETYIMHLQNILRLMDEYENYFFIPLHDKTVPDYNIYVSENGIGLITRTKVPLITMDIRRPTMTIAFREHLLRKSESLGYDGISKERVRMELRALIQELKNTPPHR